MDETVFNVVQLVDIVYHFLAGIVNEFLNKGVSAKGNTKTDVSFSREGCKGDRVLDGCEACVILKKTFSSGVGVVGGDAFHQEVDDTWPSSSDRVTSPALVRFTSSVLGDATSDIVGIGITTASFRSRERLHVQREAC